MITFLKKTFLVIRLPFFGVSQMQINNVQNRNSFSFNGEWNYIIDPYETGFYSFHHEVLQNLN
ncbi:hypothetical protein [Flavobacterium sp.]|uniref:hypothetical protein n=1 Tax=Flavobacterium sp. TaxID=239 RepID=UPI003751FA4B